MSETALAVVTQDSTAVTSPLDQNPATFRAALERRGENRKTLLEWVRGNLVEGTDYGYIHVAGKGKCSLAAQGKANDCKDKSHWSPKPSLWKSGAEKICGMLEVIPTYPTLPKFEEAALQGVEIKSIILKCDIVSLGGTVLSTGVGARSLTQDYGDLNKSLKMAKKSAHIDATMGFGGLSEVFTLDLEDMTLPPRAASAPSGTSTPQPASGPAPEQKPAQRASSASPVDPDAPIGPDRATKLLSYLGGLGFAGPHALNTARKYKHIGPDQVLADLTEGSATALIARMRAKLPGQTKGEPPVTPKGDSESQAFEAAQGLEADIDLGDVDISHLLSIMLKHSAFDGDVGVLDAIAGAADNREAQIDVARTMRDALIGVPPDLAREKEIFDQAVPQQA